MVKAQMEIQQMTFMILAVFMFFALAGLFFISIYVGDLKDQASALEKEETISSIEVIASMPELAYDSSEMMMIDSDKAQVMANQFSNNYSAIWPVASIELYKVYPDFDEVVECPGTNCNYYKIYDNGQNNTQTYASFVSICRKEKESGYIFEKCEIGKLVVGVEIDD